MASVKMTSAKRLARIFGKCSTDANGCLNYPTRRVRNRPVLKLDGVYMYASRAVWMLVNGDTKRLCVLHKCDNSRCLNPQHLFLGTPLENSRDMVSKGRSMQGERSPNAKLTDKIVLRIKRLRAKGLTQKAIAIRTNSTVSNVSCILTGRGWKHILPTTQPS